MENRRVKVTKLLIRESFLKLLKQKPISRITVTELCKEADINRGSFYAHYVDIYDLLEKIEDDFYLNLSNFFEIDVYFSTTKNLLRRVMELINDNRDLSSAIFGQYGDTVFLERCCYIHRYEIMNVLKNRFPDVKEIELNYVYVFTVRGAVGILSEWIKNDFSDSAEKIADIITEMHHAALNQLKIMQENRQ